MAVFKCKMCGGALEINSESGVAVCEYCGSVQTLPKRNDEVIANLFNRANNLRIKCEFDKAAQVYEKILNEDNSDAEAHWGLLLCKYGIEYVEDPKTYKRIPTCHRTQYESVLSDVDYLSALANSDGEAKNVYKAQAEEISELQKNILAIVKNEKPFDVFICYKETDENGKRTVDSALANDIYYQLTQEGLKVFYAAITLEDKLGQEYEPYIFAALNSAKVMLVVGTKPEFFDSVWVRNEWSRYLKLMKTDRSRLLIPCYRAMDAYDLPEEFAHLQAQDMSKIGFVNDVVRGIKKVVEQPNDKESGNETAVKSSGSNTASLLERAFMFLEDGDWQSADEYCEKVLDIEPKNAMAYLGKLMAELKVSKPEQLGKQKDEFTGSINYQKACRFADDDLKSALDDYAKNVLYLKAQRTMNTATEESNFKTAASIFDRVKGYKDADSKKSECLEKAEACRKDAIYTKALKRMECDSIDYYSSAISAFETIKGWKDSDEKIAQCKRRIEEIKSKEEAKRLERERKIEEAKIEAEKRKKLIKKIVAIATPIAAVLMVFIIVLNAVIMPQTNYKKALNEVEAGNYSKAYMLFEKNFDYKDTQEQIKIAKSKEAFSLLESEKYDEAYMIFKEIGNDEAIINSKYERAVTYIDSGDYEVAFALLNGLNYKDSNEKLISIKSQYYNTLFSKAEVGSTVFFGSYEQDNDAENGKEDIEWFVLDKEGEKILVVSKYALDCQMYNEKREGITWETCTIRKWLNNDFLNAAFNFEEKAKISSVPVSADKYYDCNTNVGNATKDKLFLLSVTEVNNYFSSDSARLCKPTPYAVSKGVYIKEANDASWWWLRSPGSYYQDYAAYVDSNGDVCNNGSFVCNGLYAVRPAMWIDISE